METHPLDQLVNEHRFFSGLPDRIGTVIAGCARNQVFKDGEHLGREGEPADHFYLLRDGRVALEIFVPGKAPLVVETLEAGDTLGWSWLVLPYRWMFDARAIGTVRTIALDGHCLRGKLADDPVLANSLYSRFIGVLAERLTGARLRLIDMFAQPGSQLPSPPEQPLELERDG